MATTAASDAKRAKPQLNVYTALLTVSLLLAILGCAVLYVMNTDATGQGPFDVASGR
jgi:hypothetical protein